MPFRILYRVYRILVIPVMVIAFLIGLLPYMIYMKWFVPCPECGKRGTFQNTKKVILKTTLRGKELTDSWLYFVCSNCGKVQKDMDGTWHDVNAEEWEMVKNRSLPQIDPLDDLCTKSPKKTSKKPRRKNKS